MSRNNKRQLEPTEVSYIIVAKVTGEISGQSSGSQRHARNCYCFVCVASKGRTGMSLNPDELSELIKMRIV